MNKFIATSCELSLHEDDWLEGEGKLISAWNEDLGKANTIVELLERVPYLAMGYGRCERIQDQFENDPCNADEKSRFDADLTVDIEDDGHHNGGFVIIKPTEEKWKKFRKGEVKLCSLHICVHIAKITDLDIDDIWNEGWRG